MDRRNQKVEVIPANSDIPCSCCGRYHRKIKKIDGFWLGSTCEQDYSTYYWNRDPKSLVWKGWEKKFAKVHKMVTGKDVQK